MSLKAKIEAVIYASEEPVTLVQLLGLLGGEGQAELDELASQQQSLALEQEGEQAEGEAPPEEATPEAENDSADASAETSAQDGDSADEKKQARERERLLRAHFRSLLDALIAEYASGDRGMEIREIAGGFRFATKPEYHDTVRGFVKSLKPPLKLTLQALETLAVIAYKQPVTAPEISEIRGVDSGGVIGSLMTRKLVVSGGRKQVIGRPILYKTTKDFLLRFGLKDISELPSIEEFEKMAGELDEAIQEEIPMGEEIPTAHESVEDMMSDQANGPAGGKTEHADSKEVEPTVEQHPPQADGDSTEPASWTPDTKTSDSIEDETASNGKTGGA